MTDYNFAGQYQQNPQPPAGNIVKRAWLKFYSPEEKPDKFDQIIQSWDTANKDTELADYSVCTTWGIKDGQLFLLDAFRDKLEFPALKRKVQELAKLHGASIVLIEDKASGTSLIQELRAAGLSQVQAAPSLDGDKIMRLRVQTAKIEGGFVHFPQQASWLDDYLRELLAFPNVKYADQVDSTVFAMAWSSTHPEPAIIQYYRKLATSSTGQAPQGPAMRRIWVPGHSTTWYLISGRGVTIPPDRIIEVTEEEGNALKMNGGRWVD
jgi:predicted phage terminase large subunit-like protein